MLSAGQEGAILQKAGPRDWPRVSMKGIKAAPQTPPGGWGWTMDGARRAEVRSGVFLTPALNAFAPKGTHFWEVFPASSSSYNSLFCPPTALSWLQCNHWLAHLTRFYK